MNKKYEYWKDDVALYKQLRIKPSIAWPTILLFIIYFLLSIASLLLYLNENISLYGVLALNTLSSYISYTVLHEASHGLISTNRKFNDFLGYVSLFYISITPFFKTYRYLHAVHHKYTNDKELDPDFACASRPLFLLPLKWIFMDYYYVKTYFNKHGYKKRPKKEKIEFWLSFLFAGTVVFLVIYNNVLIEFLFFYILPTRISLFLLSITFDFMPHFPNHIKASDDKYKATNNRIGFEMFFDVICIGQNYHLAHHLYPNTPFYRYKKLWYSNYTEHMKMNPTLTYGFSLIPSNVKEKING